MKNLIIPFKAGLVAILLTGLGQFVFAATYTASVSGNWSSSATWGGTAPGASISGADNLIINSGVTVTLDENVTLSNASASLAVAGALTGTSNLTINGGTLTGAGTVDVNTLTVGAGGAIASTGTITVNQLANSSTLLTLLNTVNVTDSVELNAGVLELGLGGIANLSNNVTLVMAGGSFTAGTGTLNLGASYNLYYTGTVSAIGLEASLTGLQNVTVNLSSPSGQLALSGNLTVAGNLSVQQGSLSTGAYTLTINGGITASGTGSITGSSGTSIVLNGSGSLDTLSFAAGGQTVNNVTVNIGSGGSVALGSNLTVAGALALNNGSLALNGNTLNLGGTISATGTGGISGSAGSGINVTGTGNAGTLSFTAMGDTVGNLSINIASGGSISLGSALVVAGTLSLNNSSLSLNGQNLTVNGTISTTGSGSISGSASSNITFSGSGSAGTLVLTAGSQTINNLNINIGSSGNVAVGSAITVGGTLNLVAGTVTIDSTDLTIGGSGSITGGSSSSYVITAGSGSLVMTVANSGASGTFQVGTQANFAPVVVTNNSSSSGNFTVNAQAGVYANGTSGANLALNQSVVNTSWNVRVVHHHGRQCKPGNRPGTHRCR